MANSIALYVAWNPNPLLPIIAVVVKNEVLIINSETDSDEINEQVSIPLSSPFWIISKTYFVCNNDNGNRPT